MPTSRVLLSSAVAAAAAVLTACDAIDAPTTAPTSAPRLAVTYAGDTTVTTFTYDYRNGVSQQLGVHKLVMPAGSVCDPKTSTYGVGEWDKPCTAARSNITITARSWTKADGHAQVDFHPNLRFVPTTSGTSSGVKLFFKDKDAADSTLAAQLRIDWVPRIGAAPVDEYATDPTLRTQVNTTAGMVWRQIKHFSGYTMSVGRTESGY